MLKNDKTDQLVELNIFADEIFASKEDDFSYIGVIYVPIESQNELIHHLLDLRCISNNSWHQNKLSCTFNCRFHESNNTEIHYVKLGKSKDQACFKIAKRWIDSINVLIKKYGLLFNILAIDHSKLSLDCFHSEFQQKYLEYNIYNRFFRTVVLGGIKYFFPRKKVIINQVYHDKGGQQDHPYFPWHLFRKLEFEEPLITCIEKEISFLDSDHRKSGKIESNLIQLVDILIGSIRRNFIGKSEVREKNQVALSFQPLLRTILDRKKNEKSGIYYGKYYTSLYHKKASISLFPESELSKNNIFKVLDRSKWNSRERGSFFYNRKILLQPNNQKKIDNFFK